MRVIVRFTDGEVLEGESQHGTLGQMGFPVAFPEGNNKVAWISLASIKCVLFPGVLEPADSDPREAQGLPKVVLHFLDGEMLRTYRDELFVQDGEGFTLRMWDPELRGLVRTIVPLHALKAAFFVNDWDGRGQEERLMYANQQMAHEA